MRDFFESLNNRIKLMWTKSSKSQKILFFSLISVLVIAVFIISIVNFSTRYVPLYTNLPLEEVNQIKEELDARNITYELSDGGQTIKVPDDKSDQLLVELAGQGIPRSGNISYSFFSENASWGITDNEFNMMKLAATQTELENLIKSIDGIEDANVMISLPKQSVFINDSVEETTAAIILQTKYGYEFNENQIESLYHLVSKALPNLSEENIKIRNQYLEYFERSTVNGSYQDEISHQQSVKKGIEDDIQKRLQQMLGVMVGMENVVVSVTADVDFKSENRVEDLVEPVDVENIEGIPLSLETIKETYTGLYRDGEIAGTGDEDIPNLPGELEPGEDDGDYELLKDTVNFELNRIHKDISDSPYKVRDLGIQVVINNNVSTDKDDVQLLSQQEQNEVEQGVTSILNSIITTSINKDFGDIDPENRISIVFQPFSQHLAAMGFEKETSSPKLSPLAIIVISIIVITIVFIVLFVLLRRRKPEEVEVESEQIVTADVADIDLTKQPESESDIQKNQIEHLANEKPEEFAKLLRSWLADD